MNQEPTIRRRPRVPWLAATVRSATVLSATVIAAAVLAGAPAVSAQEEEPIVEGETATIRIGDRARAQIRLAFPKADLDAALSAADRGVAQEIEQTLRDDLAYSGIFNVQGPTELAVLTLTGERAHDFEQYRSLGNEVVLLATIKREDDKIVLEGRVYDLPSAQSITGKRYRGLPSQARRVAHTLADALHLQFTGRPGIALTTIAFQSDRDASNRQELYLMDYDGHNQRRISSHQSTSGFSDWSPTGDAIAYMSYFSGSPGIYYVDLQSNRKVPVYAGGSLNLSPSFSPDGKKIAFSHTSEINVDVYTCERECRDPRRLTTSRAIDTNPAWSPDGRHVAFTSDRSGKPNVYVMDVDGGNVRRLSFEGDYNDGACWRPDGTHLVYASRRSGFRFQVTETSLVDLATRTLTNGPDSYEEPCYAPDGRHLVFTVKRGRESQIHVMNADGTLWRQLTHQGNNLAADWSPFAQ
jgi:TolB protein